MLKININDEFGNKIGECKLSHEDIGIFDIKSKTNIDVESDIEQGNEGFMDVLNININGGNKMQEVPIEIDGVLWVNYAKYENVDKIVIDKYEVNIYNKGEFVGSILRENIKTLVEQNYEKGISVDLIDNLMYLFDITKEGDFGKINDE